MLTWGESTTKQSRFALFQCRRADCLFVIAPPYPFALSLSKGKRRPFILRQAQDERRRRAQGNRCCMYQYGLRPFDKLTVRSQVCVLAGLDPARCRGLTPRLAPRF